MSLRVAFCVVVVCNGEPSNGSGTGNGDGAVQFRRSAAAVAVQCVVCEERGLTWESSPASWPWQQRAHGSWVGRLVRGSKGKRNEEGPVVCRSEVRPLADSTSDGNVMEFQSGGYHASPRLLSSPLLSRRLLLSFPSQTRTNVVAPPQ